MRMQHKIYWASILGFVFAAQASYAKPTLRIARDRFPSGHASAEGVACDLARAFIERNAKLFQETCISSAFYGNGQSRKSYQAFLKNMSGQIRQQAKRRTPAPLGVKKIDKVFAVRRLSKSGPASYGYAALNLRDVAFVDVLVKLENGGEGLNRTLTLQRSDGKWYAHPLPSVSPLLSDGLNDERPSTATIADTYALVPAR